MDVETDYTFLYVCYNSIKKFTKFEKKQGKEGGVAQASIPNEEDWTKAAGFHPRTNLGARGHHATSPFCV